MPWVSSIYSVKYYSFCYFCLVVYIVSISPHFTYQYNVTMKIQIRNNLNIFKKAKRIQQKNSLLLGTKQQSFYHQWSDVLKFVTNYHACQSWRQKSVNGRLRWPYVSCSDSASLRRVSPQKCIICYCKQLYCFAAQSEHFCPKARKGRPKFQCQSANLGIFFPELESSFSWLDFFNRFRIIGTTLDVNYNVDYCSMECKENFVCYYPVLFHWWVWNVSINTFITLCYSIDGFEMFQ